jgi:hypothetical protein
MNTLAEALTRPPLIELGRESLDADSISQNTETQTRKTGFAPLVNQSRRTESLGQSKTR